jgi:hypothetical protein
VLWLTLVNLASWGSQIGLILQTSPGKIQDAISKIIRVKKAGGVAQAVEQSHRAPALQALIYCQKKTRQKKSSWGVCAHADKVFPGCTLL